VKQVQDPQSGRIGEGAKFHVRAASVSERNHRKALSHHTVGKTKTPINFGRVTFSKILVTRL
jgi:hypothetical protein